MRAMRGSRIAVGVCISIVATLFLIAPTASGLEQDECENNSPVVAGLPNNPVAYPLGVGAQCSLTLTCGTGVLCGVEVRATVSGLGLVEGGILLDGQVYAVCGPTPGNCQATAQTPGSNASPHIITCYARAVLAVDVDVSCSALRPD